MGNLASKPVADESLSDDENFVEYYEQPITPMDPRSPTPDILRTPLKITSANGSPITKNVDLNKALDNYNPAVVFARNPILSTIIRNHLLEFDPRSPTADFERTPLDKLTSSAGISARLNTEEYNDSLGYISTNESMDEEENAGLIARNLIDGFANISVNDSFKNAEECGSNNSNINCHEGQKYIETNFDYVASRLEIDLKDFKDPRSPSIGIDRTPIVLQKPESPICIKTVEQTPKEVKTAIGDALLIYEDDGLEQPSTPQRVKMSNGEARTPLSCVKNKTDAIKTASEKSNSRKVSKIPRPQQRLREKNTRLNSPRLITKLQTASLSRNPEIRRKTMKERSSWGEDHSVVL